MEEATYTKILNRCLDAVGEWRASMPGFDPDDSLNVPYDRLSSVFDEYLDRLTQCYPFFSPHYAAQMLKPPHPVATLAYFAAMHINPNNHALDGGPATSSMEAEAVEWLADMFGFSRYLGHLTSSGTMANLEALWIANCLHSGKAIAFSSQCHYTHPRLCRVIGAQGIEIRSDARGRLDLNDLEAKLKKHNIGTVVATVGTTGLGAVDPVHELARMKKKAGFRIHADAAYGGFFKLLADPEKPLIPHEPFRHLKECDSIVVDPHKHGLQPYGCGCVIFADPAVGKFHKHDSPYTYFTSKELHLGEISLECSRAGAAAAALWVTLKCLPLKPDTGLGPILAKSRLAAMKLAGLMEKGGEFEIVAEPELDIIAYLPRTQPPRASTSGKLAERLFETAMEDSEKRLYLAKMKIAPPLLEDRFGESFWDTSNMTVLRSVLMKPEHLEFAQDVYDKLVEHLRKTVR